MQVIKATTDVSKQQKQFQQVQVLIQKNNGKNISTTDSTTACQQVSLPKN